MRPIDADELLNEINELKKSPWYNRENGNYERLVRSDAIGIVVDLCIKQAPTLDYAPVRHGEWILRHVGRGHYWECSECHTNSCIYVTEDTKFCPNCGALMDGKEDAP